MSSFNIGIVAEGPRDMDFIENFIYSTYPDLDLHFYRLQPEEGGDTSENGCGWKGVRKWCEQLANDYASLEEYQQLIYPKLDLIIVQIDTDIVYEEDIASTDFPKSMEPVVRNFEPDLVNNYDQIDVARKVDFLQKNLSYWFDGKVSNADYAQCIPSDNFEAWVVFAFDQQLYHQPPAQHIEQLCKPDHVIGRGARYHGIKISRKNNKLKKSGRLYQEHFIPRVIENWAEVSRECEQARAFEHDLLRFFTIFYLMV